MDFRVKKRFENEGLFDWGNVWACVKTPMWLLWRARLGFTTLWSFMHSQRQTFCGAPGRIPFHWFIFDTYSWQLYQIIFVHYQSWENN